MCPKDLKAILTQQMDEFVATGFEHRDVMAIADRAASLFILQHRVEPYFVIGDFDGIKNTIEGLECPASRAFRCRCFLNRAAAMRVEECALFVDHTCSSTSARREVCVFLFSLKPEDLVLGLRVVHILLYQVPVGKDPVALANIGVDASAAAEGGASTWTASKGVPFCEKLRRDPVAFDNE
jgi:hypothetical protein